jgi:hypothetical protein
VAEERGVGGAWRLCGQRRTAARVLPSHELGLRVLEDLWPATIEEVIGAAVGTAVEMVVGGGGATSAMGSGQGPRERSHGVACDVEEARSHHNEEEDRQEEAEPSGEFTNEGIGQSRM